MGAGGEGGRGGFHFSEFFVAKNSTGGGSLCQIAARFGSLPARFAGSHRVVRNLIMDQTGRDFIIQRTLTPNAPVPSARPPFIPRKPCL